MYRPGHKALPGKPLGTILCYNYPYWPRYLGGAGLALIFIGVGLLMPLVIRSLVDHFEHGTMTDALLMLYFGGLLAIAIFSGLARYGQRRLMIGASRKFEYDLRNDYFRHAQSLSQDYYRRVQTGDIMARATNDLNYVRMWIGPGIMGTVDLIRMPFALGLMVYFCAQLTLIALLPLPFVSLAVYFFVMFMHRQSKRVQEQFSVVSARAQENLAGARVVKAYGLAERESAVFQAASAKYMRENIKLNCVMAIAHPLVGFIVGASVLIVYWRGGTMVILDQLSLADFSGFVVCLMALVWPLVEFGWVLTLYQRGAVAMNRITEVLAVNPSICDTDQTRSDIESVGGAIRFEDVAFAYDGHNVLEDISFNVPEGQTVAIVGPTGAGKSSIVSLLTREYDPSAGRVCVGGLDAREIPLRVLKDAIGYVPQDTFLFSDTIAVNLTFGKPDATQEQMDSACEIAQFASELAEMPDGYDTLLGERGVNLSGGQKQRLAIARAVVKDPRILILDDALSSVDTHTEAEVLQRLKTVMAQRTSVIIAHRVSTVQHADLILVMDHGRIVERGKHEDLVALGGLYADMHRRQLLEEALERE